MKFSFLLLFIILFKIISAAIDFKHSVCDDKNTHDGYWICDKNPDNTYNVTFDCSIQNNNKASKDNYKNFYNNLIFQLICFRLQACGSGRPNSQKT